MRRLVLLLVLLASSADASVIRYKWQHTSSGFPSTPVPNYLVCDTEAEMNSAPLVFEGDRAYTKDSDKLWKRTLTTWVEIAGGGGAGTPSGSASDETALDLVRNAGVSTDYSRGDHTHGSPSTATIAGVTVNQATALAADPTGCAANTFAQDIVASGNLSCAAIADADVPDNITIILAATATALAANPANCGVPGEVPTGIDASGVAEGCFTPTGTTAPHNLLSNPEHPDTIIAAPAAGMLIVGQGGGIPLWDTLAMGAGGTVLRVNPTGTAIQWSQIATSNIADDQVTFAKTQNITTARFLGRVTGGSGDIEELSTSAHLRTVLSDESGTGPALFASTSAELRTALSDESGTGAALFASTSAELKTALSDETGAGPAVFGATTVRLAANSNVSSTTKANLTGFTFSLAASTNYTITCRMINTANAATVGVQYGFTFSGTVVVTTFVMEYWTAATTKGFLSDSTFPVDLNPTVSQGGNGAIYFIEGNIEVTNAGTLQVTHGSETATLTTTLRGSWCRLNQY